jgi:hypothetical protein
MKAQQAAASPLWDTVPLGSVLERIESGKSPKALAASSRTDDTLTLLSPETTAVLMERFCGPAGLAKQLLRHAIAGKRTPPP